MLPAAAVALLAVGAVTSVLAGAAGPVPTGTVVVLVLAGVGCLAVLVVAVGRADRAAAASDRAVNALRASVLHGHAELQRLLEQLQRGERPPLGAPPAVPVEPGDPTALLQDAVYRAQHAAKVAVAQASVRPPVTAPGAPVEVFVNLARRLQSLVHRTIQLLDDLENQVEDPDLLRGLFQADHLVTRIRRHAENLAVLGGADSRRQWTTPQAMTEVMRSAIAEVEQYSRVKLVPPIEGTLHGHAVADVIHLIAELVENATAFSPPHTLVLLRVQPVTAGLVVEVEDRGLGMSRADQQRVNELLADPQRIDIGALLRDGRLGLYVVSVLARRHGIAVQLQTNVFGGTQAVVVVPHSLLGARPGDHEPRREAPQQQPQQWPTLPRRQPAALATAAPQRVAGGSAGVPSGSAGISPGSAAVPNGATGVPAGSAGGSTGSAGSPTEPAEVAASSRPVAVPLPRASAPAGRPDREPEAADSEPELTREMFAPAIPPGATGPDSAATERAARPPLPRRTSQKHLVPQLQQAPAPPREEPAGEHDPHLMAAFRQGFSHAVTRTDEEDGAQSHRDQLG